MDFKEIKEEHGAILQILKRVELMLKDNQKKKEACELLNSFVFLFDTHENKEREFLLSLKDKISNGTMKIIEQEHITLRVHWIFIKEAVSSRDSNKLAICLDSDYCQMLISKLRKHLFFEEKFLEGIYN